MVSSIILVLILFLLILYLGNHYIDILKEFYKRYDIFYLNFYLVFFQFILSESLLFISFFWTSYHLYLSTNLSISISSFISLPISLALSYTNTILLSNAGISLGTSFLSIQNLSFYYLYYNLLSFLIGNGDIILD